MPDTHEIHRQVHPPMAEPGVRGARQRRPKRVMASGLALLFSLLGSLPVQADTATPDQPDASDQVIDAGQTVNAGQAVHTEQAMDNSEAGPAFDHTQWNQLLSRYVHTTADGQSTQVDYQGINAERPLLTQYLEALATVSEADFQQWHKDEQLAFLINAYNAWTVERILTSWPNLDSIKDLGNFFSSPWSKKIIPLLGQTRSLDDIEHTLIRQPGRYNNPLIHFAVNCASIGCPPLRAEAYSGAQLDIQLNEQTRQFLSNRQQNRLDGDVLAVSSIFKWYREDFEQGWKGYQRLEDFFLHYHAALALPDDAIQRLQAGQQDIEYLDYDWRLNRTLP